MKLLTEKQENESIIVCNFLYSYILGLHVVYILSVQSLSLEVMSYIYRILRIDSCLLQITRFVNSYGKFCCFNF